MARLSMTGMKELDKQFDRLTRSAGKAVMRKTLREAAQPILEAAQGYVPEDSGGLRESISISTRINKAQRKLQRKAEDKATVEMFVGSSSPLAHLVEFGTAPRVNGGKYKGTQHPGTSAQPFMRPAFEGAVKRVMEIIQEQIVKNMQAAIGRAERRAAKRSAR